MKKLFLIIILLSIYRPSLFSQSIRYIKIIHWGDVDNPVGTLLVSIDNMPRPYEVFADDIVGHSIKTDKKSFEILKRFIKTNDSLFSNTKSLKEAKIYSGYAIIYPDDSKYLLGLPKVKKFFHELKLELKRENADQALISYWQYY